MRSDEEAEKAQPDPGKSLNYIKFLQKRINIS